MSVGVWCGNWGVSDSANRNLCTRQKASYGRIFPLKIMGVACCVSVILLLRVLSCLSAQHISRGLLFCAL